ncbi:MAG: TldD/PmbA family protein [Actinobacteria bacterium]|nr:TldD/PmbA family protein [Actinomycetota bacterium]
MSLLDRDTAARVIRTALSRGGEFAELFAERRSGYNLRLEEGKVEENTSGWETGAGIRVICGESVAYAYTNDLSLASLEETARAAAAAAKAGRSAVVGLEKPLRLLPRREDHPVRLDIDEFPRERKVELLHRADQAAREAGSRIVQVVVVLGDARQEVFIANSLGEAVTDLRMRVRMVVQAVAAHEGEIQTGHESPGILGGYELFQEFPPEEVGRAAALQALTMLEARPAPSGPMAVVIANGTGGVLFHEACGHGLEADAVYKKASVFAGRLGEKVASPLVNAFDDATLVNRWGSFAYDDEGVRAGRTPLIREGVLVGYINDRKRAMRDGTEPTGNGRRQSYRHVPIPRMSNTYIEAGRERGEDIIADTELGLYARKLGGGEVNPVTGDFIFAVTEGYMIRGGKVAEPVKGATLIGNGPRVLLDIDAVGSDLDFDTGMCGKEGQAVPVCTGQPTLRVRELVVGGTTEVV